MISADRQRELLDRAFGRIMRNIPDISGAVLASPDGLLLFAVGTLEGEEAAACAAWLGCEAERCLGLVGGSAPSEAVYWAGSRSWCVSRMQGNVWLMASASASCQPGLLRVAAGSLRDELGPLLGGRP